MPEVTPMEQLFQAGAHYGYSRSRRHPSVEPYLYGFKNRTAIIDLEKTLVSLARAEEFVRQLGRSGKRLILVGTKPEAQAIITAIGAQIACPVVTNRWIGGTLTNFPEIRKRLERLGELKQILAVDTTGTYTKQERARLQKELDRLVRSFGPLEGLTSLPGAIYVIDSEAEKIAASEARSLGLPVLALSGTDCNLGLVDYPIVANDASIKTIEWVSGRLARAYQEGYDSREPEPTEAVVND